MNDPITESLSFNFEFPLEDNWDSYGGRATTDQAKATVKNLHAFPLSGGGMQIDLHAGGSSIEIEINPDGQIHSVFWEKDSGE